MGRLTFRSIASEALFLSVVPSSNCSRAQSLQRGSYSQGDLWRSSAKLAGGSCTKFIRPAPRVASTERRSATSFSIISGALCARHTIVLGSVTTCVVALLEAGSWMLLRTVACARLHCARPSKKIPNASLQLHPASPATVAIDESRASAPRWCAASAWRRSTPRPFDSNKVAT